MSQPTLASSFSGINYIDVSRGSRLSYTSLRAASGDNSISEERLSTPNVHVLASSRSGSERSSCAFVERSSSRLSQPDVRRMLRQDIPGKRERLSQPTLVTGDFYPGRGQQRLSHPCLSGGRDYQQVFHSPLKHKRFYPASTITQRDRIGLLDFGAARYKNLTNSSTKFNRDRFSIPELESQNELRLLSGTPKQRFSLDSQLTQDQARLRLQPIASSPISEHQPPYQAKSEDTGRPKLPVEGLESVIRASTSPILPPSERQFLSPHTFRSNLLPVPGVKPAENTNATDAPTCGAPAGKTTDGQESQKQSSVPVTPGFLKAALAKTTKPCATVTPVPTRERMSVPEIRNSSLRRLLDPPTRQRHSITGSIRQSILSPNKENDLLKKPRSALDEALQKLKKFDTSDSSQRDMPNNFAETAPKQRHSIASNIRQCLLSPNRENEMNRKTRSSIDDALQKLKKIENEECGQYETTNSLYITEMPSQKHYSYTYEKDEGSSVLGKLSVTIPCKKFLESNFDENERVITTVIETDVPVILTGMKYGKKTQVYSSETPKWIRKCLENESPKGGKKTSKSTRRSSRKSSLESISSENKANNALEKPRSKSVGSTERAAVCKTTSVAQHNAKNTFVTIVSADEEQDNKPYEISVDWRQQDNPGLYNDECIDSDTDESTSI